MESTETVRCSIGYRSGERPRRHCWDHPFPEAGVLLPFELGTAFCLNFRRNTSVMTPYRPWIAGTGIAGLLLTGSPTFPAELPATRTPDISRPMTVTTSDQPGILTPRGKLAVEPSFQYSNSSSHRVALVGYTVIPAIVVGLIDVREVNRDTFIAALGLRLGLTHRMEIEAKLPYVSRSDTSRTRELGTGVETDSVFNASGRGLGDVEVALRYQLNSGTGGRPYFIGNLRVKTHTGENPFQAEIDQATGLQKELPTGSGFWGIQPSLSMIYPSDPAVLFANVSYLWNVRRSLGVAIGSVDPGDAIGLNFGLGFALNERMSFSLGYDHSVIGKDRQNGAQIPNSMLTEVGSLLLGFSFRPTNKTSINLSLAAGLTEPAPDVQITVRIPMCCVDLAR